MEQRSSSSLAKYRSSKPAEAWLLLTGLVFIERNHRAVSSHDNNMMYNILDINNYDGLCIILIYMYVYIYMDMDHIHVYIYIHCIYSTFISIQKQTNMYLCICHEIMDGMIVYLMVCPFAAFHRNLNHATKIAVCESNPRLDIQFAILLNL